jgi:hypothetical protein
MLTGSITTAGSFCLFCEKTVSVLPTVTSVSPPWIAVAGAVARHEGDDGGRGERSGYRAAPHVSPPYVGDLLTPGTPRRSGIKWRIARRAAHA